MIKTKNLVILMVIILVLGGISIMQKSQHRKQTTSSATEVVLAGEFNKDNLAKVTVGFGDNPEQVVMVAGPDGWRMDSYHQAAVNGERLATLLRNLSNLKGEFRSSSDQVLADYGLQKGQSVTIRGFDKSGTEVLALDLGKTPKGFPGQFMRRPDSSKVYLSQTGLLAHLGIYGAPEAPKAQYFLELQAIKENRQELDGITIVDAATTMAFTKKLGVIEPAEDAPEGTEPSTDRTTWEWLLNGKPATGLAKTKIDGVLNACASIRASDVADPAAGLAQYGLDHPRRTVSLLRKDGTTLDLKFGTDRPAGDGVTAGTYLQVADEPTIWVVTDYTVKNIFKSREDLKAS